MFYTYSPTEQFKVFFCNSSLFYFFDFRVTNIMIIFFLALFFSFFLFKTLEKKSSYYVIPTFLQKLMEASYKSLYDLMRNIVITKQAEKYFPFIYSIFCFLILYNLIGLIPNCFTVTSHFFIVFSLALITFFGVILICFYEHNFRFLFLFLPFGSPIFLAFILVPIEVLSFFMRPLSLSIRLFSNILSGHILLKVIAGFAWQFMLFESFFSLLHFIPFLILILMLFLEIVVALIQVYIFLVLICVYLNEGINLH